MSMPILKKGLFITLCVFLWLTSPAHAADITIKWDANVEPNLTGYKIYYGLSSGSYEHVFEIGDQTSYTLSGLNESQVYYVAVTAYDFDGNESDFSDEIVIDVQRLIFAPGDFDGDGDVDSTDLAVFAAEFGRTNCGEPEPCKCDFDGDGDVDGADLTAFANDFGRTNCP